MINKAVFLYTFLRLAQPTTVIKLVLFVLAIPTALVYPLHQAPDVSVDLEPLISFFASPVMTLVVSFMFVSSSIGNTKSLDDGEYLALLFSRPLHRSTYIFSKWLAGSILVCAVIGLQLIYFIILINMIGRGAQFSMGFTDTINLALNAFGTTALVVMIHAFPAKIGVILFAALFYLSFAAPLMVQLIPNTALFFGVDFRNTVKTACNVLRAFMYSPIDMDVYLSSIKMVWLPAVSFVSNTALYLCIAVVIMNKREFFYTNE